VRHFSESFGEEAGAHFTSRDIIYLMTDLLLCDADLTRGGNVTVYENCTTSLIRMVAA
jgi:type I restriction enzyme M protein